MSSVQPGCPFEINAYGYPDLNKPSPAPSGSSVNKAALEIIQSSDALSAPARVPANMKTTNLSTRWSVCNLLQQISENTDFKTSMQTYQKDSSSLNSRDDLAWYLEIASIGLTEVAIFFAISTTVGLVPFVFPWVVVGILGGGALIADISLIINRLIINKEKNRLSEKNNELIQHIADNAEILHNLVTAKGQEIQQEIVSIQIEPLPPLDTEASHAVGTLIEASRSRTGKLERLLREQAAVNETLAFLSGFYEV